MTATTVPAPVPFRSTVRSEWTKLRTVRSTRRFVPIVILGSFGLTVLAAVLGGHSYHTWTAADQAAFDPVNHGLISVALAQIATAVVGVLAMTGEHSSGTLRTTLMATPRRERVLAAKAVVLGVGGFVVGLLVTVPSFVVSQALLHGYTPTVGILHGGVVRSLVLSAGYLAAVSLIGLAVGTLLRSSAAAIAGLIGFLFVAPEIAAQLPHSIADAVLQYQPMAIASSSLSSITREPHTLGPWPGSAVLLAYVAVFAAIALPGFRHRDA
jgi:ABC-type transport system involved in multi-copper enzyme maturation permease subunit